LLDLKLCWKLVCDRNRYVLRENNGEIFSEILSLEASGYVPTVVDCVTNADVEHHINHAELQFSADDVHIRSAYPSLSYLDNQSCSMSMSRWT
jgi:hypothetical protein